MNNEFKEIEDIEVYNYEATRKNLDSLLAKYRTYKSKKTTIEERIKNSIDLDNLGIFSSRKSDPTYNKVEQLERINNFIDTVDKVIKLNKNKLSKDEYLILKKCLDYKYTTDGNMHQRRDNL